MTRVCLLQLAVHTEPSSEQEDSYFVKIELSYPIVPNKSSFKVLSTKVECKLAKAEDIRWLALEGGANAVLPAKRE